MMADSADQVHARPLPNFSQRDLGRRPTVFAFTPFRRCPIPPVAHRFFLNDQPLPSYF
jgi:hypothetical protein